MWTITAEISSIKVDYTALSKENKLMTNKVTLSTITSLIKSMETKRKSAVDFAVRINSRGFTESDGKHYFYCGKPNKPDGSPNTVSTLFYGVCAYNSTNYVNFGNWSTGVKGIGIALIGKTNQTGYEYLYPLKSTSAEELRRELKGIFWNFEKDWLSKSFTKEQILELRKKYKDAFQSYNTKKKIWTKGDPKDFISEEDWIKKGYPCTYRYGFAWKGAKSRFITKNEAMTKYGHTFESRFEKKDGVWVLNLQDYSENDLY